MDEKHAIIEYRTADGKRICVEVSTEVKELLEQSDRQIRSHRRQDRRYLFFAGSIDWLSEAAMNNPLQTDAIDLVMQAENHRQLHESLRKLPEAQHRRVLLYYFNDLTHQQISELEHVERATITQSIQRALKQLHKIISAQQ